MSPPGAEGETQASDLVMPFLPSGDSLKQSLLSVISGLVLEVAREFSDFKSLCPSLYILTRIMEFQKALV